MSLTFADVQRTAQETGFPTETVEKVLRLLSLLNRGLRRSEPHRLAYGRSERCAGRGKGAEEPVGADAQKRCGTHPPGTAGLDQSTGG